MRRIDILRKAGRGLKNAKARTILTSLAIAVGAFTLTASLAGGEGARQFADKLISSNVNPQQLFITKDDSLFGDDSTPQQSGLREYDPNAATIQSNIGGGGVSVKQLTQNDIDMLMKNNKIASVHQTYNTSNSIEYVIFQDSQKKYVADFGRYDPGVRYDVTAGNLPAFGKELDDGDAIIPDSYAKDLGVKNLKDLIGKKMTITLNKPVTLPTEKQINTLIAQNGIAGLDKLTKGETKDVSVVIRAVIRKPSTAFSGVSYAMISNDMRRDIAEYTTKGTSKYHKYIYATVTVKDGISPETVKKELRKQGYAVRTVKDLQSLIFTIVNLLQGIAIGFGVIALLASVFGIINTQYISVLERTSQIGLMKSLGMRNKDVAKLFRYEAAWIGFLGGTIGAVLSWITGTLLNPWITKQIDLGDGNYLFIFQPLPIASLILGLVVIAVVAGYFPARKAAKLDPIEALRTE